MATSSKRDRTWMMGEFTTPDALLDAARKVRALGFTDVDTYSPYPLHGADEALGLRRSRVPLVVLAGGLAGATLGYFMQYWMNAVDYAINVGGRPLNSPPQYLPITFECGVLLAALSAFFGLLFGFLRLPQPYHPVFEVESFRRASVDRFWLSVASTEGVSEKVMQALAEAGAASTSVVEGEP